MFPFIAIRMCNIFVQVRALSNCTALNGAKEVSLKQAYRIMDTKKLPKKKSKKKHIVIKRVSDDIEAVWLENLSIENLKLFRKTSFGSFRKINVQNFIEKLKEMYPSTFLNASPVENRQKEICSPVSEKTEPESDTKNTAPCLSEYLIKHIVEFPLLRSENESSFCRFAQTEVENFGSVDSALYPSVTGILNATMSSAARLRLKMWKERMIEQLGLEGFNKYQEDLLRQGTKFHATLKTYLQVADKTLVTVDPEIEGCWKSLEKFLPDISSVQFVEESIHHPILMYKGVVDCVATYRGTPCVIEWKKTTKLKSDLPSTYDAPLQVCAYLGALPWHKNVTIENGLVVVAYTDGKPANVHKLSLESCEVYWTEWLRRVQSYWLKKSTALVQNEETI